MDKIPVLDFTPDRSKEPVLLSTPRGRKWSFSFRNWNQIEFFGLDRSETKWFVSLLDKLKELSDKQVDEFISCRAETGSWRYHKINWNHTNIPVQRADLNWVDKTYLGNADDYPLVQFQVSKALGRVVGFWDENNVFNIVLLDPLHNIQPSKDFGYKVDPCSPLSCEYTMVMYQIDRIKSSPNLCAEGCGYREKLATFPTALPSTNVIMHYISDEQKAEVDGALKSLGGNSGYTDLLLLAAQELTSL